LVEIVQVGNDDTTTFDKDVEAILDAAANALGRPFGGEELYLRADGGDGGLVGGLSGFDLQGWLFVKFLAVTPEARGSGVGAKLLVKAEDWARRHGLAGVYLDTFDFQAPEFYAKCGYTEFGRLPAVGGYPQRIWFAKVFGCTTS
jgi:GNAT superfamily N-acetyltransferase